MARTATNKLYVNLSASQTRKRLKGHGFGVKRVETAGRNQAVISHTATGGHLEQLRALFVGVVAADCYDDLDVPVENLRNLGPASAAWLRDAGVHTKCDLEQLGPVLAYRLVQQQQPAVSLNLLWAMAAGLQDKDWRDLNETEKTRLRAAITE